MHRIVRWIALPLTLEALFAAGAQAQEAPTGCPPSALADAIAPTAEAVALLEGRLRLFAMDTVNMRVRWKGQAFEVRRPDSALVAEWRKRSIASAPRPSQERPPVVVMAQARLPVLVGVRGGNAEPWWDERIAMYGGGFELGACPLHFMCMDGNTIYFRIDRISPTAASGRWNDYQTGLGRMVDERGKFLANPAGYFCLLR
jgi:hypothetical protein